MQYEFLTFSYLFVKRGDLRGDPICKIAVCVGIFTETK